MRGYVVTRDGTFGVVERCYDNHEGEPCVVIRWGPIGWLTPAYERDCKQLVSPWEAEAKREAEAWLSTIPAPREAAEERTR